MPEKVVPPFWLNLSKIWFKILNSDQDEMWKGPSPGKLSRWVARDICWQSLQGENPQATIFSHEALLLVSKNSHSQNSRKLPCPWDYRLILCLTTATLNDPHPSSLRNQEPVRVKVSNHSRKETTSINFKFRWSDELDRWKCASHMLNITAG